ncbi:MAG: hypothetical protein M1823_001731 [Watsoniomyces obsoletus]|nr:MAG: hypothetical protein M1823_001731 [Watsoniomyces obsoletus]
MGQQVYEEVRDHYGTKLQLCRNRHSRMEAEARLWSATRWAYELRQQFQMALRNIHRDSRRVRQLKAEAEQLMAEIEEKTKEQKALETMVRHDDPLIIFP